MDTREVQQQQHTRDLSESYIETHANLPLLALLSNSLVLHQTVPYLPVSARLRLAATSRALRDLVLGTPGVFRHLDLAGVNTAAQVSGVQTIISCGGGGRGNNDAGRQDVTDDFCAGPLRGIFGNVRRRGLLGDVQTLVLDGLPSVTAELVNDILVDPAFRVRVLSLREAKNLNEQTLMRALRYACRPTRPDKKDTPRLKALYVFGKKDTTTTTATMTGATGGNSGSPSASSNSSSSSISTDWNQKSQQALKESIRSEGDEWYHKRGRVIDKSIGDGWAETLLDCRGAIRFDAVLCTGPRHQNSPAFGKVPVTSGNDEPHRHHQHHQHQTPWAVATFAVGGCASCGSAPEGFTVHGESPAEELPLLAPVPLHSSNVRSATCPRNSSGMMNGPAAGFGGEEKKEETGEKARFVPRCIECIRERYCFSCDQWWCESCYQVPSREELAHAQHVHIVDVNSANSLVVHEMAAFEQPKVKTRKITKSCWECDLNCETCIADTQKICKACGGGYCILHYEGSTQTLCDWCSARRGRRSREMY